MRALSLICQFLLTLIIEEKMDNSFYGKSFRLMKLFSLTFAAGLLGINLQAKTIQLTMQHMEQPPSRVEAMQVVVDLSLIHI